MTDFSTTQKKYMDELFLKLTHTFNENTAEIKLDFKNQIDELKKEIQATANKYEDKIAKLEETNKLLNNNIIQLQRKVRKNNLIIFSVDDTETDLLKFVTCIFNDLLEVQIRDTDIRDIYKIGSKKKAQRPVVVELASYQKKQLILGNAKKLKGTNISIAQDLCPEDRKDKKILTKHLKEAKQNGIQAYLKGNKVVIGNKSYTAEDLENDVSYPTVTEEPPRPSSAPSTPNPQNRKKSQLCELGIEEEAEQQKQVEKKILEKLQNIKIDKNTNIYKTRSAKTSTK